MYSASIKWYNYTTIPNILILNVPHTVIQLYIIQLYVIVILYGSRDYGSKPTKHEVWFTLP